MYRWLKYMRYDNGLLELRKKRIRGYLTAVFHCLKEDYRQKGGPDSHQRHTPNRQEAMTSYSIGNPTSHKSKYLRSQSGEELFAHSVIGDI